MLSISVGMISLMGFVKIGDLFLSTDDHLQVWRGGHKEEKGWERGREDGREGEKRKGDGGMEGGRKKEMQEEEKDRKKEEQCQICRKDCSLNKKVCLLKPLKTHQKKTTPSEKNHSICVYAPVFFVRVCACVCVRVCVHIFATPCR